MAEIRILVAAVLTILVTAGCGSSADPLVERLAAAPRPDGAVEVSSESADGDFERGPRASADYSLPDPLAEACPDVLTLYLDAGYTLTDYVDEPDPITDPQTWCADELDPPGTGPPPNNVIAIAYPPDSEARYPSDGIYLTLVAGRDGDPNPDGTLLRISAQ